MTAGFRIGAAAREPDQAGRLLRFRDEHPSVDIRGGEFGSMRALIPARNGDPRCGREVFGHTLRELLDKLYSIFPPAAGSG